MSACSHMMKTGDFDELNTLRARPLDDRTATLPDDTRLRMTPAGQKTVDCLVSEGDMIRTSYGTGGKVVDVSKFSTYGLPVYSITYVKPEATRNLQGNYRSTDYCWINECVAQDDRVLLLFLSSQDEVFVVQKVIKGRLLKTVLDEHRREVSERPQPKFKVGDQVYRKCDNQRQRLIVKYVIWFSYGKTYEYILAYESGKEVFNPYPGGPSSFLEGELKPAESRLAEYVRMSKRQSSQ